MDSEQINALKTAKTNINCIRTSPNYEMLQNPKYAEAFQFTPIDMRDTAEEKEATDMVIQLLNLAYIKEDQSKVFAIITF